LRGTIARLITAKTGRELAINGDLQWQLHWPQYVCTQPTSLSRIRVGRAKSR
jgi:uncharacterized protein involved in outer membrane biogenesis